MSKLIVAAYGVLAATLVATRTIGLDNSLWHDEVLAVQLFIRAGPREIVSGPDLNHELFGILAWGTTSLLGESEITLRIWGVVPFIAAVTVVTTWLHRRFGAVAGLSFLFLATTSPLLLDISRQARGYGLAFLAMAVMLLAALETVRTHSSRALVASLVAGVLGTWTLPQFGIAFVATGLALLFTERAIRARVAMGLGVGLVACAAWYAPHLGEVRDASRIEDGTRIGIADLLVSPFHHVLTPALLWLDGTVVDDTLAWIPLVVLAATVIAFSPLLRDRATGLVTCSGIVATLVVLWAMQAYVIPRYLSFLLVPLLLLLATGVGVVAARLRTRPTIVGTLASTLLLGLVGMSFLSVAVDVIRYPREAYKDVAATIDDSWPTVPVVAYMRNTEGLEYYLDRPFRALESDEVADVVCTSPEPVVFVQQPFGVDEVDVPCLDRNGVERVGHRQYARGGVMNAWLVPPG